MTAPAPPRRAGARRLRSVGGVAVPVVVVDPPEDGVLVVAEPLPGAEAAGAEVGPVAEAAAPAPRVVGALPVDVEEDGPGLEKEASPRAALVCGVAAGAAASTPGRNAGWLASAREPVMPDTSG